MMRPIYAGVIWLSSLSLSATALSAQGSLREQTTAVRGTSPSRIISVNPFMPLAGYFQGEYEQKLQDNISVAVSASSAKFDNRRYLNADVKLRMYPQDRGLEGLGLAAGIGLGNARQDDSFLPCTPVPSCTPLVDRGRYITRPSFSVESHYQWMFGRSRATAVAVGGGLKRYFISDDEARGIGRLVPTGRLTIGWAFR
jgi:hypothetical protein